ncbi:MAG TPA: ABC transporter transmembrane domain-containing protein [Acidimicrobiales bacterium]|nr:ABC transporter transmembrane domain-containing protein [Acidimicrobiales bacterium]
MAADVAVTALGLGAPWPVMAVIDKATSGTVTAPFGVAGAGSVVPVAVGAGVALVAMIAVFEYLSAVLAETAGTGVGLTLRAAAFTKLLRLPGAAYPTGDLVTRLTGDVVRVQDAAVDRWRVVVANAFALVGMVSVLAALGPLLAAVTAEAALAAGLLRLRRPPPGDHQHGGDRRRAAPGVPGGPTLDPRRPGALRRPGAGPGIGSAPVRLDHVAADTAERLGYLFERQGVASAPTCTR